MTVLLVLWPVFCHGDGSFGDAVRELDSGVGQILSRLKRLGIDKETLVIFSSDNGAATYAKESGKPESGSKARITLKQVNDATFLKVSEQNYIS